MQTPILKWPRSPQVRPNQSPHLALGVLYAVMSQKDRVGKKKRMRIYMHLSESAAAADRPPSPAAIVSIVPLDDDDQQPLLERCTHTHTHMHAQTHAHTHTHTCMLMQVTSLI